MELPAQAESRLSIPSDALDLLGELADRLRSKLGLSCDCDNPEWGLRSDGFDDMDAKVTLHCVNCTFEHTCCVSLVTLRELTET